MLVVDVRKAHLCAPATREVYIEIPKEDKVDGVDGDVCGHPQFSMYETRDAAKNWSLEVERTMGGLGFKAGVYSPCLFYNEARDISALCHGDDIVMVGRRKWLEQAEKGIADKFDVKSKWIGAGKKDARSGQVLGRIVTYGPKGIRYEADPRHAEISIRELEVQPKEQVVTPGVKGAAEDLEKTTPSKDSGAGW